MSREYISKSKNAKAVSLNCDTLHGNHTQFYLSISKHMWVMAHNQYPLKRIKGKLQKEESGTCHYSTRHSSVPTPLPNITTKSQIQLIAPGKSVAWQLRERVRVRECVNVNKELGREITTYRLEFCCRLSTTYTCCFEMLISLQLENRKIHS